MSQKGTQLLQVEVKKRATSPTLRFKMWEATGSGPSFWWVLKKALQVTKQNKIVTSHLMPVRGSHRTGTLEVGTIPHPGRWRFLRLHT